MFHCVTFLPVRLHDEQEIQCACASEYYSFGFTVPFVPSFSNEEVAPLMKVAGVVLVVVSSCPEWKSRILVRRNGYIFNGALGVEPIRLKFIGIKNILYRFSIFSYDQ